MEVPHIVKKSIKVLCDSIPKGIRSKEFNRHIKHGVAHIKSFPGSIFKQLHHYSLPTLDENPDVVIIHVGINDLISVYENNKTPENEIAD